MKAIKQWDTIIEYLSDNQDGIKEFIIAKDCKANHSWISRIMFWMEQDGFAVQDQETRRWYPGVETKKRHAEKFI